MPFANFHAARVKDPSDFESGSFRTKEITKGINMIIGKLKKGGTMEAESYHFDKTVFTAEEAKKWLKDHKIDVIEFVPAKEGKSMNQLEMKDKRTLLSNEVKAFVELAKKEVRKLTEAEDKTMNDKIIEIAELDKEIKSAEEADKNKTIPNLIIVKGKTQMGKFNLNRAVRNAAANSRGIHTAQHDDDRDIIEQGAFVCRNTPEGAMGLTLPFYDGAYEGRAVIQAQGGDTVGGTIVPEDKWNLLLPLRNKLVAIQAGATMMTGLVGNISLPTYAGTTAAWKGEVSASTDGAGATSEVLMQPYKLCAYIDVSNALLLQDSSDAQNRLKQDLVNAVRVKLEGAMFAATTTAGAPTTLMSTCVNDISGSISGSNWNKILQFPKKVDTQNALLGQLAYITSPTGKYYLQTTGTSTTYDVNKLMAPDGTIFGYPSFVSNNVTDVFNSSESGLLFGNWNDLLIGQWGGLDIIIDGLTQAVYGNTRLLINTYFCFVPARTVSITAGSIKA